MVVGTFFAHFPTLDLIVHKIGERIAETNKMIERKKSKAI